MQIFDQNGKLVRHFGSRGKNDGEIWYPTGVAVDSDNNIFVADHGNHRVQVQYLKTHFNSIQLNYNRVELL